MSHLAPTCGARWDTSKIKAKSVLKMLKVNKLLVILLKGKNKIKKHYSEEKKSSHLNVKNTTKNKES